MCIISKFLKVSLVFLVLVSCVKNDYTNLSDEYEWEPVVSVPVFNKQIQQYNYAGGTSFEYDYTKDGEVSLSDTIDFDLEEIVEEQEYIEQYMLRLNVGNGFPAKLTLYALYLNQNYNIVSRALTDTIRLDSAQVDIDGNLTDIPFTIYDEYVDEEEVQDLEEVRYILIRMKLSEGNLTEEVINNLETYYVDLKVGLRMYINYPVN